MATPRLELVPDADPEAPQWVTLDELLRDCGPYFGDNETPSDEQLFGRLLRFGHRIWELPDRAMREFAAQVWSKRLDELALPRIAHPWRVVQEAILAGDPATRAATAGWRWITAEDVAAFPPIAYTVGHHLPDGALALLYGPTGTGKTFAALDLALSVATGEPWHGEAVHQGPVAYIVAEGVSGIPERLAAWKATHEPAGPIAIRFLPQPVRFLQASDTAALLRDLQTWTPAPRLVVVDTFAWCLAGGDENSAQDVGIYLAAIRQLRELTAAAMLTVHHTGHDRTRERGSSALAAAMDTVIAVKRDDDAMVLSCEKQRDGLPFQPMRFRLRLAGPSLVPQLVVGAISTSDSLSRTEQTALDALRETSLSGEFVSASRWQSVTEISERSFWRARKRLVELAVVESNGKGYRATPCDTELPTASEVPF